MSKASIPKEMLVTQMEEALEERQNSDRRKVKKVLPQNVVADRRKGTRRNLK